MRRSLVVLVAVVGVVLQPLLAPPPARAADDEPAPTITAPRDGSTTGLRPTVRGTAAHDDSDVYVELDGAEPDDPQGHGTDWSWTVPTDLEPGDHKLQAFSVSSAGRSVQSEGIAFHVDEASAAVPGVPTVEVPREGATVPQKFEASGSLTKGDTGTERVQVLLDDRKPVDAEVDKTSWRVLLSAPDAGRHSLRVRAVAADGTLSDLGESRSFGVDASESAPVVLSPADGSSTGDRTPTISGTAAHAESDVYVVLDGAGTKRPQARGTRWSWTVPDDLEPGRHTVRAFSRAVGFGTSEQSAEVTFEVREKGPGVPGVEVPADGASVEPGAGASGALSQDGTPTVRVRVFVDDEETKEAVLEDTAWHADLPDLKPGKHTLRVRAVDADGTESGDSEPRSFVVEDGEPVPVIVSPAEGAATADPTPTVFGTAAHDDSVTHLEVDGREVDKSRGRQWSFALTEGLEPGWHKLRAYAESAAGRSAWSDTRGFEVRERGPAAPLVKIPEPDAEVGAGSSAAGVVPDEGTAGVAVRVYVDGEEAGTGEVQDGSWRVGLPALDPGEHTLVAQTLDADGVSSALSKPRTFTVREGAAPPVVTAPRDGSGTVDRQPVVRGTASSADSRVYVELDGKEPDSPQAGGTTWSWTVPDALDRGTHTLRAYAVSKAGGRTAWSETVTFEIRDKGPGVPAVERPGEGDVVDGPLTATGPASDAGTPTTGVRVLVDDADVGAADLEDLRWSFALPQLTNGTHTIAVQAVDAEGTTSSLSRVTTFDVEVDLYPPSVTSPRDGAVLPEPPTVSGEGVPGATVVLVLDDRDVAKAPVRDDGSWTLEPGELRVDEGTHTLAAYQVDTEGHRSATSVPTTFTLDTTTPEPPTVETPVDGDRLTDATFTVGGRGEAGTTASVLVDDESVGSTPVDGDGRWSLGGITTPERGGHTVTAVLADAAGHRSDPSDPVRVLAVSPPPAPRLAAFPDGSPTRVRPVVVEGTAEPGAKLVVYLDESQVDAVEVAEDGSWRVRIDPADGTYAVSARAFDGYGVSEASNVRTLVVDTTPPEAPTIVDPADGTTTPDTRPDIVGRGEPGAEVVLTLDGERLEDPDQTPLLVGDDGSWTYRWSGDALRRGSHTLGAHQVDPVGNAGAESTSSFVVETVRPIDALVVDRPEDGAVVDDARVPVSGRAQAGATVSVRLGSDEVGSTVVADDGSFSLVTAPLSEGENELSVTQTPVGADESSPVIVTVTVKTTDPTTQVPGPPVITAPDAATVVGPEPELSGTGLVGATVTVLLGGEAVGSTVVDQDGRWTLQTRALPSGTTTLSVTQTAPAGTSAPASLTLTVDATPPDAPVITSPANGTVLLDGTGVVVEGRAEAGSSVAVSDGDVLLGTARSDADGRFELTVAFLADGPHRLSARASDRFGNESAASGEVDLVVGERPVVSSPQDGDVVVDDQLRLTGFGTPGSVVAVRVVTFDDVGQGLAARVAPAPGDVLATGVVGVLGRWEVTTPALAHGLYRLVVDETLGDASGPRQRRDGSTGPLTSVPFDVAVADAPTVTSPGPDEAVEESWQVCGTGEPGWTIRVVDEDTRQVTGTSTVGIDGGWCVAQTDEPGTYTRTVVQQVGERFALRAPDALVVQVVGDPSEPGDGGSSDGGGSDGGAGSSDSGSGGGSSLAATGGPSAYAGLLGLGLTVAGVALLGRRRRRAR